MNKSSKVMSAREAVESFVNDDSCIAFGGFVTNRRAYGLVREIIRQGKRNLYVEGGPSGGDVDMLIGAGCVKAIMVSYIANSGFTSVGKCFRRAVEKKEILFDDYSMDVQSLAYHGAALGLPFVPIKHLLMGSDIINKWGITAEERAKNKKLPRAKFICIPNPFNPIEKICCVPTPNIDVACIHVQRASTSGMFEIQGPEFQDIDIAMASQHTIISCEDLVSDDAFGNNNANIRVPNFFVDAVVHMPYGSHPSQCYNYYDYDVNIYQEYNSASEIDIDFKRFIKKYIFDLTDNSEYINLVKQNEALKCLNGHQTK